MAVALGMLVLAVVAALSLYGSKSFVAMGNYADLDQKSRNALDVITREIRQSSRLVAFQTNLPAMSLTLTNANQGATVKVTWYSDMGALVLELSVLVMMRRKWPARDGLFVIGGGRAGLYLVAGLPMLTWCATFGLALTASGIKEDFIVAVVLAATTYPAYALCRRLWGGPPREESVFDALAGPAEAP